MRWRTSLWRVSAMQQLQRAMSRETSVGIPLRGLPPTRFPGREIIGRHHDTPHPRPPPTPLKCSRRHLPQRQGGPVLWLSRRARTLPCPARRQRAGTRPAAPVRLGAPRPAAGEEAARAHAHCGPRRCLCASRARALKPLGTWRGTYAPSVPRVHRTIRLPAVAVGAPIRGRRPA